MLCNNEKWQVYAEAAAISYKSEKQISNWQLSQDPQYARFLLGASIGPFRGGTDCCEYSYAIVDGELIISFPGTRNGSQLLRVIFEFLKNSMNPFYSHLLCA